MDTTMTPLGGGAGETFLAESPAGRSVVRIYGSRSAWRDESAPLVDAAVLRIVRGILPVPDVLEVRVQQADAPGLLVASELPGEPGDQVVAHLADEEPSLLLTIGPQLGAAAARIAGAPMLRRGVFADGHLRLVDFPEARAPGEVLAAVESAYAAGAFADWPRARLRGLGAMAARAEQLLADGDDHLGGAACLSHGDLTLDNVLLDPRDGRLTGIVDWEYAHAGTPWADLGTLLRSCRDASRRDLADGVLTGWRDTVRLVDPPGAGELRDLARAADLLALADLAARAAAARDAGRTPSSAAAAAVELLGAIADVRDLHAELPPG